MRDRVEQAVKLGARVIGEMSGSLARGKLRPSDMNEWAQRLRWAADALDGELKGDTI